MRELRIADDARVAVRALAFSRDGRRLLAVVHGRRHELLVLDAADGSVLSRDAAGLWAVPPAWTADLSRFARYRPGVNSTAGVVEVVRTGGRAETVVPLDPVGRPPEGDWVNLALGPDARWLVVAHDDRDRNRVRGLVRAFDAFTRHVERAEGFPGSGVAVAFAPDGSELAVWHQDGLARWPLGPAAPAAANTGTVRDLGYAPDGRGVAAVVGDGVAFWPDPVATTPDMIVPQHDRLVTHEIHSVAWHPAGRVLAVARGNRAELWDAAAGRQIDAFEWDAGTVRAVAFAPDGLTCAAGGNRNRVVFWDTDA